MARHLVQGHFQPEGAADARRALDADVATHQFGQAAGNGQPQPGAAEAAGGGDVGLLESLEQAGRFIAVHADAGVVHGKADDDLLVVFGMQAAAQDDAALFGEFDGIAQEIEQDLADAHAIAVEHGRQR